MNSITQDINFKQSVIKYSYKHGVTAASIVYKLHRKTIYRWREKYDGNARYSYNNANQNVQPNELLVAFKNEMK